MAVAVKVTTIGNSVGIDLGMLAALFLVESIRGFGPAKFRELHEAGADLRAGTVQMVDIPLSGAVQRLLSGIAQMPPVIITSNATTLRRRRSEDGKLPRCSPGGAFGWRIGSRWRSTRRFSHSQS